MGGAAAIFAAICLLVGIIGFASSVPRLRPWLTVLFGINARLGGVSGNTLRAINPIDVVLLLLAGLASLAFWPGPGAGEVGWMVVAIALPFAGIAVLFATHLAGRSSLMAGVLILSILMVLDHGWGGPGRLGIAASVLLLIGDVATRGSRSAPIATVIATGYLSLIAWFVWLAARLS